MMPRTEPMQQVRTKLKGGSLSGTYLIDRGDEIFVRKEVSLLENREYGFQRWYSQLKRMQRYERLFPGLFPNILRYGQEGDRAYFDMNYIANALTAHEFLMQNPAPEHAETIFEKLLAAMGQMHAESFPSSVGAFKLYLYEEIERPLKNCLQNAEFRAFQAYDTIRFNGVEVSPLAAELPRLIDLALKCYSDPSEAWTHGNITLENILYVPSKERMVLIDPYEETIVDSRFGEYSQVLQSCNSYYEIYNAKSPVVEDNEVTIDFERATGVDHFNGLFQSYLRRELTEQELIVTRIFEISQYSRMLPFKMAIAPEKMIFFYALGSALFDRLLKDIN